MGRPSAADQSSTALVVIFRQSMSGPLAVIVVPAIPSLFMTVQLMPLRPSSSVTFSAITKSWKGRA